MAYGGVFYFASIFQGNEVGEITSTTATATTTAGGTTSVGITESEVTVVTESPTTGINT